VLTTFPNYPAGRIYPGFRQKWNHVEQFEGFEVRRVPMYMNHSDSAARRALSYVSFSLSTLLAGGWARQADVVYVYASQMTAAIAPSAWWRLRRIPFVLHVQDLWPGSITGSSLVSQPRVGRMVDALLRPWLRRIYRRAARTIAIAPGMARSLVTDGVPPDRIREIYNWADESHVDEITPAGGPRKDVGNFVTFLYAGNVGDLQDLDTVLDAAELLKNRPNFRLRIVGEGVARERLRQVVAERAMTAVSIEDRVDAATISEIMRDCDYQIISLKMLPIFLGTIPSKLQSSFAHGMPVVTTVGGDVSHIVRSEDLGFVSQPENAAELAAVFRRACEVDPAERVAMGGRARKYYAEHMSRERGLAQVETVLQEAFNRAIHKRKSKSGTRLPR
jgi:glycosyltransferase involved in cell wall biosynthesis